MTLVQMILRCCCWDWKDPNQSAEVEAEVVDRRVVTPVDEMEPEVLSEDMNDLRSAAEGGDVQAMFKFGKALLQGRVSNGFKLVNYPLASCSIMFNPFMKSLFLAILLYGIQFYPFRFMLAHAIPFDSIPSSSFFLRVLHGNHLLQVFQAKSGSFETF
jgi:hypothetical protein